MVTKKGTPLSSVADFPVEVSARLADLWITTAEELVSSAVQEGGLAGLVAYIGLPEAEVTRLVEQAQAALPPGVSFAPGDIQPHGLGALDEREEGGGPIPPPSFAPLPPSVDMHARFGPVRDQGQRGTCVAHACAAAREFQTGPQSPQSNLSEQFLYWDCKKHDMAPGAGTYIRVGMQRLQVDGIPDESVWPYNPNPVPGNEGQDPPSTGALTKAAQYRILDSTKLSPTSVDSLRQALAHGSPVAFSVPVFTHWFREPTQTTGDVRLPLPGEKVEGGHAMCMVGYETDPNVPGGGYFLVRNSWGEAWGSESPIGAGHARLPFAFINQYGSSAFIIVPGAPAEVSFWQQLVDWLRGIFK